MEEPRLKPESHFFINYKKAFDSVHRGLLMKILRAHGIPGTIVRLIDNVYTGTVAKVLTAEGCTEVFDILAGVLQGDTLAPLPIHHGH